MSDDPRGVLPFKGGEDAVRLPGFRLISMSLCAFRRVLEAMARLRKWIFEDDRLKEYFEIRRLGALF